MVIAKKVKVNASVPIMNPQDMLDDYQKDMGKEKGLRLFIESMIASSKGNDIAEEMSEKDNLLYWSNPVNDDGEGNYEVEIELDSENTEFADA